MAHATRKSGLTDLQLVLLGKGMFRAEPVVKGPPGGLAGVLFGDSGKRGGRRRDERGASEAVPAR